MRYILLVVLLASAMSAQTTNCTSVKNGDTVSTNCSTPQPIPLPALNVQSPAPVAPDSGLMMMAAMSASNRPPSARQVRNFCKKHPGQHWTKRNFNGTVVAEGSCPTKD